MPATKFPFPFIGAGQAEYFEYCEVVIKFANAPDKTARKKIISGAPAIFSLSAKDFTHTILKVTSGRFVNRLIQKHYGSPEEKIPKGEDPKFYCSARAASAFEKALLKWLKDVNDIQTIEVVLREEDGEAGGTKLSSLHEESVKAIPEIFDKWKNFTVNSDDEFINMESLFRGITSYARDLRLKDLSHLEAKYSPATYFQRLLNHKDLTRLNALLKGGIPSEIYFSRWCEGFMVYLNSKEQRADLVVSVTELLIDHPLFLQLMLYPNMANNHFIFMAAFESQRYDLIEKMKVMLGSVPDSDVGNFTQPLYLAALRLAIPQKKWDVAIGLCTIALHFLEARKTITHPDPSFYCNVLWLLQRSNTGLPVSPSLNERFLKICLPQGVKNPAVYSNAAFCYMEMDDAERALKCIKEAIQSGLKGTEYSQMRSDLLHHPVFELLRARLDVKEFLATLPAARS